MDMEILDLTVDNAFDFCAVLDAVGVNNVIGVFDKDEINALRKGGKDMKGIYPSCADFTTDLHSMGQFIQDGSRIMFETIVDIETPEVDLEIPEAEVDTDGLNYLVGKTMDYVNKNAMRGTQLAHTDGRVPNLLVHVADKSEEALGELFYFFEFACGVSGYLLGVNPFNQPGVESYKKNMFALLGKPGYEAQREELLKRL